MSENEKRRRSFKLKLYIHNKNSGGFLEFIRDGIKVYVSIEARFVRIIKIYLNKYNADIKRFPERICGFIKDDELEKLYSSGPLQIPVEVSSFPTYRSRIQKKINDEFELLNYLLFFKLKDKFLL